MSRTHVPIGLQMTLPKDYDQDREFMQMLTYLQENGCDHVELNIPFIDQVDPTAIQSFLAPYGLKCNHLATGGTYPGKLVSLSHQDESVRRASTETIAEAMRFCAKADFEGIILGIVQGSTCKDRSNARENFSQSLKQLVEVSRETGIIIIVECLSRYISNVCNTLDDTYELIRSYSPQEVVMLPDTYHMNMEEDDLTMPLHKHQGRFRTIHVSENNRFYPAMGCIDFRSIYRALEITGFSGYVTIEGNVRHSFQRELEGSVSYLNSIISNERVIAGC